MKPVALVVTTVHWPDDTRIRERLIRSLQPEFDIVFAAKSPGPSDCSDLRYLELQGGRLQRNLTAMRLGLQSWWDVLVLHDPELIFTGLGARLLRGKAVVLDVHENIPATAMTRDWVPGPLRRLLALAAQVLLRFAEKVMVVTLAESGYAHLFNEEHRVFPNFPDTSLYPHPVSEGDGQVVYLGDVTRERGAEVAVRACRKAGRRLTFIGRVSPPFESQLLALDPSVSFQGVVPNPLALSSVAKSSVGVAPLLGIPNYMNSYPTKVLEYLALGVPVVASNLPGTRQLVQGLDGVLLVAPNDDDELADAIEAASDVEFRGRTQEQAAEIRSKFSWPAQDVREFYLSLV